MKTSGPNPLRQALAQSQQAGPHPDHDLLTAFAEGMLIAREREELLEHLALCAECRDVLGTATAASAEPPAEVNLHVLPRPTHPPLRSWLPWVAVAAGIVVSSAVLLRHQRKAVLTPPPQVAIAVKKEMDQVPMGATRQMQVSPERKAKPARATSDAAEKPVTSSHRVENPSVVSSARSGVGGPSNPIPASRPSSSRAASAAAAEGGTQSAQRYVSAKPATAFAGTTSPALTLDGRLSGVRSQWRINDGGQVERSFDGGTWRPMLTNEKLRMRVVSVFDSDVWIGGDDSRLYHSSDNGTTWTSVALPDKDGHEHAIMHIRFQTLQTGTVDSEDGTSWTTTDGGKTWK